MTDAGQINDLFVSLETNLRRFPREVMSETVQRIEGRTPVLTGNLKAGWIGEKTKDGFLISNIATNEQGQHYASYIEHGTEKMRAQPMIAPTLLEMDQITKVAAERSGLKT